MERGASVETGAALQQGCTGKLLQVCADVRRGMQ